jgi:hypothetical protein
MPAKHLPIFRRTEPLMMEKLTKDTPVKPQIVHGLQTIEQVFDQLQTRSGS